MRSKPPSRRVPRRLRRPLARIMPRSGEAHDAFVGSAAILPDCPRIFICGPRDVGAVPQARRLRRHIRDAMDKTSTTDRQGKTLTFASTKPRVSSAGGAEDTLAPPSDAHDTSRSTHPAEAATEPRSRNRAGRRRVIIAVAVLALVAVVIGARYYAWALRHEATDDAFIDGHMVHVAPQVGGRVRRVLVNDNQPVRAGHLLVEIDPADFRVKLDQAIASWAAARGRLAQARAGLAVAEASQAQAAADVVAARADAGNAVADLARYRATTTGAVSRQAVDAASTTAERMAAQLIVAQKKTAAAAARGD